MDEEVAEILIEEGFTSLEESGLRAGLGNARNQAFDEEIVEELRSRARAILTNNAQEEKASTVQDLLVLERHDHRFGRAIGRSQHHHARDELADLAVDELMEMSSLSQNKPAPSS